MKKILLLANHDVGLYNFRRELIQKLLENNYKIVISSPYGDRIEDFKLMGCQYVITNIDRHGISLSKEFRLLKFYRELISEEKPDVILSYTIKPNIYGAIAAKKTKIPFIANVTGLGTALETPSIMQKILIVLYRIAFKEIQTVFFQNEENKFFFDVNKIALGKHKMIPGSGVNLNHFNVLEYPDVGTIHFVFISRIMKEKGIDQYLEAAIYIRAKYPNTRFHICGFCEQKYENILNNYHEKGIIIYHGMVKDIRNILKSTHCTVHPTFYPEGMSNVLLESAACGRPIITTNRSGTREIVDEGVNGFFTESKDSKDLIEKIEKFLNLSTIEKRNMGIASREKAEKNFDREIVVREYLKEIIKALKSL